MHTQTTRPDTALGIPDTPENRAEADRLARLDRQADRMPEGLAVVSVMLGVIALLALLALVGLYTGPELVEMAPAALDASTGVEGGEVAA